MKNSLKRRITSRGLAILFLFPVIGFTQFTSAMGFSVSPVKVDLTERKKVISLQVYNNGRSATSIQAELMQWKQEQGIDIQKNISHDILITPPIFTLAPGETQVVRVGLRRPADTSQELSYRLFLQEIPAPNISQNQGLTMLMRISLPVFVEPNQLKVAENLQWKVEKTPSNELLLRVDNAGNAHSQITEFNVQLMNGDELKKQGNFYILPGSHQQWTFKLKSPIQANERIKLKAKTSSGHVNSELQLSP